jgi:hypothetical protein
VERTNVTREFHNAKIESKHVFAFGDKVNVVLKRQPLEKGQIQKWSDDTYKIINRTGNHYQVSPVHFDFKTYTEEHQLNGDEHAFTTPVYYRKSYEMRECDKDDDEKYYVREMESTEQYQYVKIVDALVRRHKSYISVHNPLTFYKSDGDKYFEIEVIQDKRH